MLPSPDPAATCLVTGATAGLGLELARGLARRGRHVTLVARDADRLGAVAAELHGAAEPCDLTDASARAALVARVSAGRRIDVLVNDAGMTTVGRIAGADPAAELQLVRTNVEPVVDLTVRCAGAMVERGAGGILNVSSIAAFAPVPNQASYGASKAFILSYTDALAAELDGTGVHVTALCPGPMATEIFDRAGGTNPVDRMPRLFWRAPEAVAEAGLEALARGDHRAFVGAPNRLAALAGQHAPRLRAGLALGARLFTSPARPAAPRR